VSWVRVTQRAVTLTSVQGLYSNLNAVSKLQQQLTSGKTISRPSDDPTGTNTALMTRQSLAGNAQQARNITDGQSFLAQTDSTLQTMLAQVQKVRELTVQALNSGSLDGTSLQDIATQVTGLRDSLLGQANTVVNGRALFGGITSGTAAYDKNGGYVGAGDGTNPATAVSRRVSDVEAIRVDISGPEAFGKPGSGKDLFAVTANIAADVQNTSKLQADLGDLDTVLKGMTTALADVGTRAARMDAAAQNNVSQQLNLQSKQSQTEDIDLAKTIMNLQMQQNGYQAALSATAKAISPSLSDYLR
jgi:flagellar hook-associated protein 3 FlgL